MKNRRNAERKLLVGPVTIETAADRKKIAEGYITNINDSGVGMVSPKELPLGDVLLFNLDMPNGWKFDLFGRIVHVKRGASQHAYGVSFDPGQATFIFNLF